MKTADVLDKARAQLKDIARRLIKRLSSIYKTSEQGRMLQTYFLHHIFTRLEVDKSTPGYQSFDALSDVAWPLVDAFFVEGKNVELAWD